MSRNASCSLRRKYHLYDTHSTHVPRRSDPKGSRQELKELRETLITLPSVIRRIVRPRILISGSAVTSSRSAGFSSCSFPLLSVARRPSCTPPQSHSLTRDARPVLQHTRVPHRQHCRTSFVVPQNARHASNPLKPKRTTWSER